jgi:hypothetical protein
MISAATSAMYNSYKSFARPAPVQNQTGIRPSLTLEELNLPQKDLKATAKQTAVLEEDTQHLAEDAIRLANPHFDFSPESIKEAKKWIAGADMLIDRQKAKLTEWEEKKADLTALLPAMNSMIALRNKGNQRQSLNRLSYTPSPPPAPSHRGAAASVNKRRCLDLEYTDANSAGGSLLNDLDSFSDNDNENEAPVQHLNYADNNFYSHNNNSKNTNSKFNNNNFNNNNFNDYSRSSNSNNNNIPSLPMYPSLKDNRNY